MNEENTIISINNSESIIKNNNIEKTNNLENSLMNIIETEGEKYENNSSNIIDIKTYEKNKEKDEQDNSSEKEDFLSNEIQNMLKENEQLCSNEEILNNICTKNVYQKQMEEIHNFLQNEIINNGYEKYIEIYTENIIFQISTLEQEKNNKNTNISSIDFGECNERLKQYYEIPEEKELIVFKIDIKFKELTYVQYEVYNPINNSKLNLDVCEGLQIFIYSPVNLNINIQQLYESLNESGYNLFNLNDSFYNDICSPYTTINGTDITLDDRRKDIYSQINNLSFCQTGCEFEYYDSSNKRVKCNCMTDIDNIKAMFKNFSFAKTEIIDNFYSTIKNSNFKILKCYKLLYNTNNLLYNIGCIIMTIIYILLFIFMLICFFIARKTINNFIKLILLSINNHVKQKPKLNNRKDSNKSNKIKKVFKSEKLLNKKLKLKNIEYKNEKLKLIDKKFLHKTSKKITSRQKSKSTISNVNSPIKKKLRSDRSKVSKTVKLSSSYFHNSNSRIYKDNLFEKNNININININKKSKKSINNINIFKSNVNSSNKLYNKNEINMDNQEENLSLNDYELNNLDYKQAIKFDKRTFLQYYWSLLKEKQLIIFTFVPNNDYNLKTVKLSLFLLSFSLYFTINGFFFTDETMHILYEDNGEYHIIYQLPQIIYSLIISSIIKFILKFLSLSEKALLSIKSEKNSRLSNTKAKHIKTCLIIRLIIFYVLSIIFMFFFWVYISCFCAVYINTQIILINDTLISFLLSMLYPFGFNLIPSIIRSSSLKSPRKNRICLYKVSKIFAFI